MVVDPLKCSHCKSSVAAVVVVGFFLGTVDELLFTQIDGVGLVFELDLVGLVGGSGCEGPAGATRTLVFNRCDDPFCSPVN